MRNKILLFVFISSFVLLNFKLVSAQGLCEPCDGICDVGYECRGDKTAGDGDAEGKCHIACSGPLCFENPLTACSVADILDSLMRLVFYGGIALVPIAISFGAYQIMSAAGNPTKITYGRTIILYSLVGMMLILLARGIASLVRSILGA